MQVVSDFYQTKEGEDTRACGDLGHVMFSALTLSSMHWVLLKFETSQRFVWNQTQTKVVPAECSSQNWANPAYYSSTLQFILCSPFLICLLFIYFPNWKSFLRTGICLVSVVLSQGMIFRFQVISRAQHQKHLCFMPHLQKSQRPNSLECHFHGRVFLLLWYTSGMSVSKTTCNWIKTWLLKNTECVWLAFLPSNINNADYSVGWNSLPSLPILYLASTSFGG